MTDKKTLKHTLQNIGLTEKESLVYLACLEIGSSPASKIAQTAQTNRVSTYDTLEKLLKKGIINTSSQNNLKIFTATSPEIIVKDIERKSKELKEALPLLKRLKGDSLQPKIRYFEGLSGIKNIYEDTLSSKTEILNYANSEETRRNWPNYDKDYVKKRIQKKIYLRGLTPNNQFGKDQISENYHSYREIRLVDQKKFDFENEIHIYDNKVSIVSFKGGLIGLIIQSQEIADTQRAIFEMAWTLTRR